VLGTETAQQSFYLEEHNVKTKTLHKQSVEEEHRQAISKHSAQTHH